MTRQLASLTREALSEAFSGAMTGEIAEPHPVLGTMTTRVKTRAIEANLSEESSEAALSRVRALAADTGLQFVRLGDPALALLQHDGSALVVDVLDPRFWLVHSVAHASFVENALQGVLWKSRDLDSCWLPHELVDAMRGSGRVKWFKTDFKGDLFASSAHERARRLRVQLEGDDAYELLSVIRSHPQYRPAAPLSALAIEAGGHGMGVVHEAADYKGHFAASGDSFELHVGLVSRVVNDYAAYIRQIEKTYAIQWNLEADGGRTRSGRVVVMPFGRPIDDLSSFLDGMFSCREPFRLWGVPRITRDKFASVEAVDLHVGHKLRIDVSAEGLRVYLTSGGCGNSVARLLANLQHRYDATIEPPPNTRQH